MFRIFCMTSNRYLHAVQPFAYLFNRYWSDQQQVVVCGFDPPDFDLPDNFSFYSIGEQIDFPFHKWSNGLITVMNHFPKDDIFGLMLEDYWLIQPVRQDVVHQAEDYMRQFRYTLKFDLCADRRYAAGATAYGHLSDIPLVRSDHNSAYHMSLMTGLWSRKQLQRVLKWDWSPHDVELAGTAHLARYGDNLTVVGAVTDPWPVRHTLAYRGTDPTRLLLDEVPEEDVIALRQLGYIPDK